MRLTFLGTGTSYGVPFVGCGCEVCRSANPLNTRLRSSVLVQSDSEPPVLVDTTPDLRVQLLRSGTSRVSGVLWTHDHNDHIIGLDDIRPLCDRQGYIPGYANSETMARLQQVFDYAFVEGRSGGFPRLTGHVLAPFEPLELGALRITPLPIWHGQRGIFAFRFESEGKCLIYATDCSGIGDETKAAMRDTDVLVLDALRHKPHVSHFHLEQSLEAVAELRPGRAFFTHIAHDLEHEATNASLPAGAQLAYDTLSVEV